MSRRAVIGILGVAAAGGGYYLYTAGGDPKVAQKEIEREQSYRWPSVLVSRLIREYRRRGQRQSLAERAKGLRRGS